MQYLITFVGNVTWDGRANGLPKEIRAFILYDNVGAPPNSDKAQIDKLIEDQMGAFIRIQGMFVQRDQGQVIDIRQTPQDRMYVPFCRLTSVHVTLNTLAAELSEADEEGVEKFKDGTEPLKN